MSAVNAVNTVNTVNLVNAVQNPCVRPRRTQDKHPQSVRQIATK
ncbi:MAG: hypothetical protein ACKN9S_15835 [Pirellula sp.]